MNPLVTTVCAASLSAAPVLTGLAPESFVASLQEAAASEAVPAAIQRGLIRKVAEDKSSFQLATDDDHLRRFQVNDKTSFTLDGEKSDRETALHAGRMATVADDEGVATRVDVVSKDEFARP